MDPGFHGDYSVIKPDGTPASTAKGATAYPTVRMSLFAPNPLFS